MKIGFDAKRLFNNFTGLGNYSRTLVQNLQRQYPENQYHLFTPGTRLTPRTKPFFEEQQYRIVMPRFIAAFWRSHRILFNREFRSLDIYHGLSHELPFGISAPGVLKIVTIHDLIFKYFPQDYKFFDRQVYDTKFKYACKHADLIIAISEQTKQDIIKYYRVDPARIKVIYQSCDLQFRRPVGMEEIERVKAHFQLPDDFILYVGSVIARKNLGNVIRALGMFRKENCPPLVVIGSGKSYEREVRSMIREQNLGHAVHWINPPFEQFPAIYAAARLFILPSFFEGFGIPLLEAMSVGTPVITSNQSALREVTGEAGLTISPADAGEIRNAIERLITDDDLCLELQTRGKKRALDFTPEKLTSRMMDVYQRSGG